MEKLQTKAVQGSSKKIKTLKEENKMKKTILTTVLIIAVLFIVSNVSYAQGSSHSGWYSGMAYVVENEIRVREQKAAAKEKENNAEITIANAEKGYLYIYDKPDLDERTDEVEN